MVIETIDHIPAGDNPFHHDPYNMGTYLGRNVCVMYNNFPDRHCQYLIVVDMTTGQRLQINFGPDVERGKNLAAWNKAADLTVNTDLLEG